MLKRKARQGTTFIIITEDKKIIEVKIIKVKERVKFSFKFNDKMEIKRK